MDRDQGIPADAAELMPAAYAPDAEAAPSPADTPNWEQIAQEAQARAASLEQQFAPLQQQVQQLSQFQQQAMLERTQAAFAQDEQRLLQDVENGTRNAQDLRDLYSKKSQWEAQQLQDLAKTIAVNGYKDKLVYELGLTQDDRLLLGDNPELMPVIASRIQADREQAATLRAELDRQRAAQQAVNFVGNPATRSSGGQGGGAPQPTYEPGSLEHMKARLGLS